MRFGESSLIPRRVGSILFTLMDPTEIKAMSAVEVKTADTYKDDGHPYTQGLMDPHMGVIEPGIICPTDNCKYDRSPGHFGHIHLELPVIHIGFTKLIHTCLKGTCNTCNHILLHSEPGTHPANPELSEQDYYRHRIKDIIDKHGVRATEFTKIIKEIEKKTSDDKRRQCMHCAEAQGKIVLDKPNTFKEVTGDKKATTQKSESKLNPRDIREWLSRIPNEELVFLGIDQETCRPEWTVLKVLPVPPITVRPSITLDSGDRSEDDLTHKLVDVLRINQRLRENRDNGAPQLIVEDLWELLQYHVTTYFDNQTSGIPPARHRSGRPLKTLTQRLKGKEGRFRNNLSGKRVNFCARTVISPDPYLSINEVGVPELSAKELTVPIRSTNRNREQMREMIMRGPNVHPGVNYIVRGDSFRVRITDRTKYIWSGFRCLNPECTPGDPIRNETYNGERPDINALIPAPNFLPGLMLKVYDTKTDEGDVQTNYAIDEERTLANLRGEDLDGRQLPDDDPNAVLQRRWRYEQEHPDVEFPEDMLIRCPHCHGEHVEDRLASIDVRTGEPKPGMVVERHLIDGDVVIFNRQPSLHRMSMMVHEVKIMDGKTFRFNLAVCTPYNADFDGDEMNLHIIQGEEARAEAKILMRVQEHILSPRFGGAVIGGIHDHISGAYILSRLDFVPHHLALPLLSAINYTGELPEAIEQDGSIGYSGLSLLNKAMPSTEESNAIFVNYMSRSKDKVEVRGSAILKGTIDKRAIGAEDGLILDAVLHHCGSAEGAKFLDRLTRITIAVCTTFGFTTGIDDEDLPAEAIQRIVDRNRDARMEVNELLQQFGESGETYVARPGRTPLETLEEDVMAILDRTKSAAGDIAKESLGEENSAVLMATSGARGSMDNLTMMAGSIGQAKVRGKRLERGYEDRVLPHFRKFARGAPERGFISSSFKRGLEPTEFFMLSVSGRESLVDTAVRTAKSGYMQRRLINALDDLKVCDDGPRSVRNTADRIIQFTYGEDGTDPTRSVRGSSIDVNGVIDAVLGGGDS